MAAYTKTTWVSGATALDAVPLNNLETQHEKIVGVATFAGDIAMGGNKVTGLAAASGAGEALRYEQLIALYLLLTGGQMAGELDMNASSIIGIGSLYAKAAAHFNMYLADAAGTYNLTIYSSTPATVFNMNSLGNITTVGTIAGHAKVATGSYTGNATARNIATGFACSLVIITNATDLYAGIWINSTAGGAYSCLGATAGNGAINWDASTRLHATDGFTLSTVIGNVNTVTYYYTAIGVPA